MDHEKDDYVLEAALPSVATYRHLRGAAGLSVRSVAACAAGLPNSWHCVLVRHGDETVGMGRIIGDGGCFFQIVDICLLPEYQRRGLGKRIMTELTAELERRAPAGAYVSLIADGDARHLYAQFGFVGTAPASVGMHRLV